MVWCEIKEVADKKLNRNIQVIPDLGILLVLMIKYEKQLWESSPLLPAIFVQKAALSNAQEFHYSRPYLSSLVIKLAQNDAHRKAMWKPNLMQC